MMAENLRVGLREMHEDWTILDVQDAHMVLDAYEEALADA